MKVSTYLLGAVLLTTAPYMSLRAQEGGAPANARVVRVMLDTKSEKWQFSVNGGNPERLSGKELTNRVAGLNLRHGDIIIVGNEPHLKYKKRIERVWTWMRHYCDGNKVAAYKYGAPDTFTLPVYHAVAPFSDPMNLSKAFFFREGVLLGHGRMGLDKTWEKLREERPKRILLLSSLYDMNTGFPPAASPYKNEEHIHELFEAIGTAFDAYDPRPGF